MLLPALHDRLVLQQNQTTALFFCFSILQQHLCIHHQSIEPSIALLHLQVPFHRVPSTANPNTQSFKNNQDPHRQPRHHQYNHLKSIMHFITTLFSLFAATATAFPTKPGYSTQPAARDAGDVSLTFSSMSLHLDHNSSSISVSILSLLSLNGC